METTYCGKRLVKITWVDAQGNAACLGLDEKIEVPNSESIDLAQYEFDAIEHAALAGIDLDRFRLELEVVEI